MSTHYTDPDVIPPPPWEYLTHAVDVRGFLTSGNVDEGQLNDVLDRHGAEGWELVSGFDTAGTDGGTKTIVLIFKRPRR